MRIDGSPVNIGRLNGIMKFNDSPTYIHFYNNVLDLCLKKFLKSNTKAVKSINFVK